MVQVQFYMFHVQLNTSGVTEDLLDRFHCGMHGINVSLIIYLLVCFGLIIYGSTSSEVWLVEGGFIFFMQIVIHSLTFTNTLSYVQIIISSYICPALLINHHLTFFISKIKEERKKKKEWDRWSWFILLVVERDKKARWDDDDDDDGDFCLATAMGKQRLSN